MSDRHLFDDQPKIVERDVTIRNLIPANGIRGVYARISGDDGETKLYDKPLDFLSVATVVEIRYDSKRHFVEGVASGWSKDNVIVGVAIDGGATTIPTLAGNFAGFAKPGDDIADCVSALSSEYRKRLPKRR